MCYGPVSQRPSAAALSRVTGYPADIRNWPAAPAGECALGGLGVTAARAALPRAAGGVSGPVSGVAGA